jgi:hypothetical protein
VRDGTQNQLKIQKESGIRSRTRANYRKAKRYSLHITGLAEARLEAWLNVVPGALVLVFLLGPDNLGVGVFGAFSFHQVVWEG